MYHVIADDHIVIGDKKLYKGDTLDEETAQKLEDEHPHLRQYVVRAGEMKKPAEAPKSDVSDVPVARVAAPPIASVPNGPVLGAAPKP